MLGVFMKDLTSILRLAFAIFALPLAATAAVSAHQYMSESRALAPVNVAPATAKSMLAGTFRNHTISIDTDGVVRGRIGAVDANGLAGLGDMKVFFLKDGKIAHQSYTSADGSFEAAGLNDGNYSFVATGAKGFAAFGVSLEQGYQSTTNNLMEVATISPSFKQLSELIADELPQEVVDAVVAADASAEPVTGSNRVQIINGELKGRLVSLVGNVGADAVVRLAKDSQSVAELRVDESGMFSVPNLEPGIYEFVAKGSEGIAALSFEAVQEAGVGSVVESTEIIETEVADYVSPELDVCTTCGADNVIVGEQFDYACDSCGYGVSNTVDYGYAGTEIGCGIAAGGCCGSAGNWGGCGGSLGGGGFGGGLGGLASLGRFAVLGWILTELFDNIDFTNNDTVPPASPFTT
ncbi:MAG: hypothetical protein R3C03_04920 [Pirellulaceae bacterium]